MDERKRRLAKLGIIVLTLCLLGTLVYWAVGNQNDETTDEMAIATQAPVGGNEDFAILALEETEQNIEDLTFDPDDFSIPDSSRIICRQPATDVGDDRLGHACWPALVHGLDPARVDLVDVAAGRRRHCHRNVGRPTRPGQGQ